MSDKNKPLNAVLIGAGTISHNYKEGLSASERIKLSAVLDVDKHASGFACFPDAVKIYDLSSLKEFPDLDLAIIATPPETHYSLIKACLDFGLNVIVEKPLITDMKKIEEVFSLAKNRGLFLENVFHWQHGSEVIAFNDLYEPKSIESIDISIEDDYCIDSFSVKPEKVGLGGAWLDSGVNALSIVKLWLPFEIVEIRSFDFKLADNISIPVYCSVQLIIDGITTTITVDWTKRSDIKRTRIMYGGREVLLNHTDQLVLDGGKTYRYDSKPRLASHYYNFFTGKDFKSNYIESSAIHGTLLKVSDCLR